MKKNDLLFSISIFLIAFVFIFFAPVTNWYMQFNKEHGMIMSFFKFALLATLGEIIALRIRTGNYNEPGFGIIPRMIVWGFLGLAINIAFQIFSTGGPVFLAYLGLTNAPEAMKGGFSMLKLLDAFTISTTMNLTFAPVMMTFHKITDTHIIKTGGTVSGLFSPIPFASIFSTMNWDLMWNFIFKKTIPFFWIPAHTITFLLPAEFRVLFAALLGIALGLILTIGKGK
ncbi:MAG: hypothetical protein Q7U54_03915 [Bacteroidales bacterium]|nr:hypothetical protein [Bacteroidales bacterium]